MILDVIEDEKIGGGIIRFERSLRFVVYSEFLSRERLLDDVHELLVAGDVDESAFLETGRDLLPP
jgi:hypothetical protein